MPEDLTGEVAAAAKSELFGNYAQGGVGGDEVNSLYALIAVHGEQQLT